MSRRTGMTLLEVLVTLFLLSLALGMVASLARGSRDVSVQSDSRGQSISGTLNLLRVTSEVEEAMLVDTPPVGSTVAVDEVLLHKVYGADPTRLQTSSSGWSPGFTVAVHYYQQGDQLRRDATYPDGTVSSSVLAWNVQGFSATRIQPRGIELRLSALDGNQLHTTATTAFRWGE